MRPRHAVEPLILIEWRTESTTQRVWGSDRISRQRPRKEEEIRRRNRPGQESHQVESGWDRVGVLGQLDLLNLVHGDEQYATVPCRPPHQAPETVDLGQTVDSQLRRLRCVRSGLTNSEADLQPLSQRDENPVVDFLANCGRFQVL